MDMRTSGPDWEALARYLSQESGPEEADAIRRWLAEDPARGALVAALDRSIRTLAFHAPPDLNVEAALERVAARLNEAEVVPLHRGHRRTPRHWLAIGLRAAAVVAVVGGGAALWRAIQPGGPARAVREYVTSVGERDSLRLPDGSLVLLGPDSRLLVRAAYGERVRDLELSGEALFDVVHDASRPFRVHAGLAVLEDLGTTFAVRSDSNGVHVVVTAGSVLVQDTARTPSRPVILRRGDRGRVGRDGQVTAERGTATEGDVAWTRGRLVFRDASLAQVRADLRRWYGIDLRVDSALAARHVTASFAGESPDQVVATIAMVLGARVERRGNTVLMRAR
jgi:transmembrane sensor